NVLGKRSVGDDDSGRVCAGVAIGPLELAGNVDQLVNLGIPIVFDAKVRAHLESFFQGDAESLRNHLGDLVNASQGNVKDPANVSDGGTGGHGSERADLGNAVFAILGSNVSDDLISTFLTKIDVDVGRLAPVGIEKTFEEQV